MNAFILAAGKGSRLAPLTHTIPKPLVRVLGVPMVERILAWLTHHQLVEAAVNIHHLAECMQRHFADRNPAIPPRIALFHETKLLGSGGALNHPHGFWATPFLLWNADILCDINPHILIAQAQQHQTCVLALQKRHSQSYLLVDEERHVCGLRSAKRQREEVLRKPKGALQALAYNGIAALHANLKPFLPEQGAFDLIDVLLQAIAQGTPVYGHTIPKDRFFGAIDDAQRLQHLEHTLAKHNTLPQCTTPLSKGFYRVSPL